MSDALLEQIYADLGPIGLLVALLIASGWIVAAAAIWLFLGERKARRDDSKARVAEGTALVKALNEQTKTLAVVETTVRVMASMAPK